jgi:hypothetical protein
MIHMIQITYHSPFGTRNIIMPRHLIDEPMYDMDAISGRTWLNKKGTSLMRLYFLLAQLDMKTIR